MRKYILLFLVFFAVSIAKAQTAIAFNNRLVDITDSLNMYGQQWGQKLNKVHPTKEYKLLAEERQLIEKFVERQIRLVGMMKDVNGSEELREAMINYLQVERSLIYTAFIPMEKLGAGSKLEDVQAAVNLLKAEAEKEQNALAIVNKAQVAYAKKNNFSIESN